MVRGHRHGRARAWTAALAAVTAVIAIGAGPAGAHDEHHGRDGHGGLRHVFVIVLENYRAEDVTPDAAPYLTQLAGRGVTLDAMYGVDHASLSNYIAMTSGNTPTVQTKADCLQYDCIFEAPQDRNLGDQLEEKGLDWKAYMESMPAPCTHPTVSGSFDPYLVGYATRHNPFVYYRDVVGSDITTVSDRCAAHDLPYDRFAGDLAQHTTGNYTLIVPNTCNDGHDRGTSCALPTADTWLSQNVPAILASKEYRHHGALIVTFDEADGADTRGCCGNSAGGRIATVVLSPSVTAPGSHTASEYDHYSVLRTIEDAFGLDCLGHACDAGSRPFGTDVWSLGTGTGDDEHDDEHHDGHHDGRPDGQHEHHHDDHHGWRGDDDHGSRG
ncbi:MAG: alkaline phosphatase family protein [Acidimicrobiia bacterium]